MPARGGEWGETVGAFANPVVLRAEIEPHLSVGDLLKQLRSTVWRALKNQTYPFTELVERLKPQRSDSVSHISRRCYLSRGADGVRALRFQTLHELCKRISLVFQRTPNCRGAAA